MALSGYSFFCNGLFPPVKVTSLPFSYIDNVQMLCHMSLLSPQRQSCFPLYKTFGRGRMLYPFPGHCHLNMEPGISRSFIPDSGLLSKRSCQVKGEDFEGGSLSGESIILSEQILERDLDIAIAEEDYARAAKIRDNLKHLHENSKSSVLATNSRFYNSFRDGDLAAMQGLWAKGNEVCCVHPGARGISGYDDVMTSWEYVWANYEFPLDIELKDVQVHVRGDIGYVTCVELVRTKGSSWGGQFVTNVFERIDGDWYICIHHASPIDL